MAVDTKPDTTTDDGGSQAAEDAPTEEASAAVAPAPEAPAEARAQACGEEA